MNSLWWNIPASEKKCRNILNIETHIIYLQSFVFIKLKFSKLKLVLNIWIFKNLPLFNDRKNYLTISNNLIMKTNNK